MAKKAANDTGWVEVSSTNVSAIRHLGSPTNELHVKFVSGRTGVYSECPRSVFARMKDAVSKGKFIHRVLKGSYPYKEI